MLYEVLDVCETNGATAVLTGRLDRVIWVDRLYRRVQVDIALSLDVTSAFGFLSSV